MLLARQQDQAASLMGPGCSGTNAATAPWLLGAAAAAECLSLRWHCRLIAWRWHCRQAPVTVLPSSLNCLSLRWRCRLISWCWHCRQASFMRFSPACARAGSWACMTQVERGCASCCCASQWCASHLHKEQPPP